MQGCGESEKRCNQCGECKLAASDFYIRSGKSDTVCKACRRRYGREYAKTNRAKTTIAALRSRAKAWGLEGTLTLEDWNRALTYFGGNCAACGKAPNEYRKIVPDHWYPLTEGYGTTALNTIPLCHCWNKPEGERSSCNASKNAKMPERWLVDHFGEDEAKIILARINTYFEWLKSQ